MRQGTRGLGEWGTAGLLLTALLICASAARAQERSAATVGTGPDARVTIENPSGSVTVTGWDRSEVVVYASRNNLRNLELNADGNRVTMKAITGFSIDVRVPNNAKLTVQCGSGSINISDVEGTIEAESASGTLQIEGHPRTLNATGISGGVTILGGGRELTHAESVSGTVVVTDARGVVDARSSSGAVTVSGRVRDARLFSVSGDVSFKGIIEDSGRLSAESSSASVELRLPANTSAEYELSTVSGNIENDFGPAATRMRNSPGVRLNFSVGGGSARVKAATVSGSVRLTER